MLPKGWRLKIPIRRKKAVRPPYNGGHERDSISMTYRPLILALTTYSPSAESRLVAIKTGFEGTNPNFTLTCVDNKGYVSAFKPPIPRVKPPIVVGIPHWFAQIDTTSPSYILAAPLRGMDGSLAFDASVPMRRSHSSLSWRSTCLK